MKTTFILILIQILFLPFGYSQIELKDANVLIIGHENLLKTSDAVILKFPNPLKGQSRTDIWGDEEITPDYYSTEIIVKSNISAKMNGSEITDVVYTGGYWINPDHTYFKDGDSLTIEFYSLYSDTLISSRTYILKSLPKPDIYFGTASPGQRIYPWDKRLFARYGPEIPFSQSFKITNYSVTVGGKTYSGLGSEISLEVSDVLKNLKRGIDTDITVKIVCISEFNQIFEKTDKFIYR
jgi:hypothetical protein